MRAFLILLASSLALEAQARVRVPMVGTWVSSEARQALDAKEQREIGCYLTVEEEPLRVVERCDGVERPWPRPRLESPGSNVLEIHSQEEGIRRRLVARAGAPTEIEVSAQEEGGEIELRRLYRLNPARIRSLENLAITQSRLVGTWRTDEGGAFTFSPDGTFSASGEAGRFRVDAGFESEGGAWGLLHLLPEGGVPRRYLLHGAGVRIGLAEVPQDLDLHLPEEEGPPDPEEGAPDEEREVVIEGISIPLPAQKRASRVVPAWEEEPAVGLWLSRSRKAEAATVAEEPPDPEQPPISQPILSNKRRICGCASSEGALSLAALLPLLAAGRRGRRSAEEER